MILMIHGEESLLSHKKIAELKEKFLKENESIDIETLEEKDFSPSELEKKLSTVPFFSTRRMIIIKNILNKKFLNDEIKKIESSLTKTPESTILIFINYDEANKKNQIFKTVEKNSKRIWFFNKMNHGQLLKWANKEFQKRSTRINTSSLEKLILYIENDLWLLNQEIEKLSTFKKSKEVTESDIDNLTTPKTNVSIFDFIDSIGNKNKKRAIENLNKLFSKREDPITIFGMIIYQIRNLIIIKELNKNGLNYSQIAKKVKKHPFVVQKTLNQVNNFSEKELKNIYTKLLRTELELKRGGKKPSLALETLSLNLCS